MPFDWDSVAVDMNSDLTDSENNPSSLKYLFILEKIWFLFFLWIIIVFEMYFRDFLYEFGFLWEEALGSLLRCLLLRSVKLLKMVNLTSSLLHVANTTEWSRKVAHLTLINSIIVLNYLLITGQNRKVPFEIQAKMQTFA